MPLTIYKSSAGSGKTYTLAKEYIKLLLQNPLQHPNILAVTFTNKATQEMKERIIQFLMQLSKPDGGDLGKQLEAETGYSAQHIRGNAQKALQQVLHNYGDFTVLTIDAFFNRIIKSFAYEMKLPLRMEVQLDTEEALNEAYDHLMLELDINPELSQYLTEFMFYKLGQDKGWYVEREIKDLGNELFKEGFSKVFKSLDRMELGNIQQLLEYIFKQQQELEKTFKALGDEAFEIMEAHGLNLKDFKGGTRSAANYFRHLQEFNTKKLDLTASQEKALDNVEEWYKKKDPNETAITAAFHAGLNRILVEASEQWQAVKGDFILWNILVKNLHALGLLKSINDKMIAYRDDNDKILISDQNRIINEIVNQADIPFLYEKTGAQYRHFLLDEFQDTSKLQWNNFRPLLEESLSENGKVLIVGDGKQSIYRWRGGDMKLLLEEVGSDLQYFSDADTVQQLDANYRSRKEIIAFNNLFFEQITLATASRLEQEGSLAQLAFADVSQQTTGATKSGGYVEMRFYEKGGDGESPIRERIDEQLIVQIKELLEEGYSYRDIACLVFSNKDGTQVAELLTAEGIPVQSSDSLVVGNAAPVKLIISLLRFLQYPQDTLMRGQIIVLLHQLGLLEAELHVSLKQVQAEFSAFYQLVPHALAEVLKKNKGNLLHVVTQLIETSGIRDQFPIYLHRLLELVYEFESHNESHIGDFIRWWDMTGHKRTIQAPDDLDAVVILTVHKAKGLQYPVVIMPYAKRRIDPPSDLLWIENQGIVDEDWAQYLPINFEKKLKETPLKSTFDEEKELYLVDALNMLYVAFTRPEERLYVLADLSDNADNTAKLVQEYLLIHDGFEEHFMENTLKFGDPAAPDPDRKKNTEKGSNIADHLVSSIEKELLLRRPRLRVAELNTDESQSKHQYITRELLLRMAQPKDLDKVVEEAAFEGMISTEDKPHWKGQLKAVLEIPELAYWMSTSKDQLNEHEILTAHGALEVDKAFVLNQQLIALNLHVGKSKKEHANQIRDYVFALESLLEQEQPESEELPEQNTSQQASLFEDAPATPQLRKKSKPQNSVAGYLLYLDTLSLEKVQ